MTFKYLVLSDVHLGNRRNTTEYILANLDTYLEEIRRSTKLDAIFIAGDLFDTLIDNHTSEYHSIVLWIYRLMYYCDRNSVKLRVLEGTPSHDWKQCRIFITLAEVSGMSTTLDLKYIDAIYIEYIESLGLHVLYVPDEATESAATTYKIVKDLMAGKSIDKVDIAIMHGMFSYQLPIAAKTHTHLETDYLDIVKYYIHIGHVHTHSVYSRIIAEGSFDRLAHSEEEPKGAVVATVDVASGTSSYKFIPNKHARVFKTIKIPKNSSIEKAIALLDTSINKLPEGSFISIRADKGHVVYQSFEELKKRYIMYALSRKSTDLVDTENSLDTNLPDIDYPVITITKENISELILSNSNDTLPTDRLRSTIESINNQLR